MGTSRQNGVVAVSAVMLAVAVVSVLLRCWAVATVKTHRFGWDDALPILALPFILTINILIIYGVSLGLGLHRTQVAPASQSTAATLFYVVAYLFDVGIALTKFSALAFYRRIFEQTSRWFTVCIWVVAGLNLAWMVAAILQTALQCQPLAKAWNPSLPGQCISLWTQFTSTAVASTIIDFLILVLPLPKLYQLSMRWSRKLLVIAVFLVGYSVIVCSIGRLVAIVQATQAAEQDLTYDFVFYIQWLSSEGPVAIMSVSLPVIFTFGRGLAAQGFRRGSSRDDKRRAARRAQRYTPYHRHWPARPASGESHSSHLSAHRREMLLAALRGHQKTYSSTHAQSSSRSLAPHEGAVDEVYVQRDVHVEHIEMRAALAEDV